MLTSLNIEWGYCRAPLLMLHQSVESRLQGLNSGLIYKRVDFIALFIYGLLNMPD